MGRDAKTECWECQHKRSVPGDCHLRCDKPDPAMTGDKYGIKNGWFIYPVCFDPTWKTKPCDNFEPTTPASAVSGAVSDAVSPAS